MFADRGLPDTLGYARLVGLTNESLLQRILRRLHAISICFTGFCASLWKEIYKTDDERKQDFEEAERTFDQIVDVYQSCGYSPASTQTVSARSRPVHPAARPCLRHSIAVRRLQYLPEGRQRYPGPAHRILGFRWKAALCKLFLLTVLLLDGKLL